jgi:hypothetical protein
VIGGYSRGALFVDMAGYVLSTGADDVDAAYTLEYGPSGATAQFVPFRIDQVERLGYEYSRFRRQTTGAVEQSDASPGTQEGRPGIGGTWAEAGVRCEACHGPGSNHVPNPQRRDLFVDSSNTNCGQCHSAGASLDEIPAAGGYTNVFAQWNELQASGGHAEFGCGFCHSPHASTVFDRERGLRNDCAACHVDQNMAFHDGLVFERGTYREPLTCESCHMPFTGRDYAVAGTVVVGDEGRAGDVRSHIFRINPASSDSGTAFFSADGATVARDAEGRGAVTLDFVCLRCHNGLGNAFKIAGAGAPSIATDMHANAASE